MLFREITDFGKIKFNNNIIGSIALRAIERTGGRALPATSKGRLHKGGAQAGASDDAIVDVLLIGDTIDVNIYIIVRFGTSIGQVSNEIGDLFREQVQKICGLKVGNLTINVKGLLSKNISKRDIKVSIDGDKNNRVAGVEKYALPARTDEDS